MPDPAPIPTPVPIHDIAPPVGFAAYPLWVWIVAGALVLALVGWAVWFVALRKRPDRVETATERAVKRLTRLRADVESADPYPFSIEVSEVLRRFVEECHGLAATKQTTREFLDSVQGRSLFSEAQITSLARFLELSDMIKFARVQATTDDCRELLTTAEATVRDSGSTARQSPRPQEAAQ